MFFLPLGAVRGCVRVKVRSAHDGSFGRFALYEPSGLEHKTAAGACQPERKWVLAGMNTRRGELPSKSCLGRRLSPINSSKEAPDASVL